MTLNQTPEQIARDNIDRQLEQAGWAVQNKDRIDWQAASGIAVRHYLTQDGKEADYVLFLGQGRPVGIIARDKTNLDIFWLKDQSLADLDNLPDPDILAEEIIENIEAALEGFKDLMATLNGRD